ncbi:MAG: hypothetical protein AB8D78_00360 [Akkermansiaceae bacterium]
MKTLKIQIGIASLAVITMFGSSNVSKAADLDLRGWSSVKEGWYESYQYDGAWQGGRYRNLGEGYYRKTTVRVKRIQNYSRWRSGWTSFELWGMPYYGANSGTILMTTPTGRIWGWSSKWNVRRTGNKVALDDYAFPELNLWEYTRKGWRFRDNIPYSRDRWM